MGADPSFIGGASAPCGVALHGSHLYWANAGSNTIARAKTDGIEVDQGFVTTHGDEVCGVAVDSLVTPPSPPVDSTLGSTPEPDRVPPPTTIVRGPGKKLAKGKAKFGFRSSEAGSTFVCKLDRGKVARCRSPKRYGGLAPGPHTFKAWAIDAAGNKDPTPAKRKFRVPPGISRLG